MSSTTSMQLVEALDTNGHPSVRLYCNPSTSPTTETLAAYKDKHFTELRLENIAIDTIHLDEFLATQTKQPKKLTLINTSMHFPSTRDSSLEVKHLVCDYDDNISPSTVTYAVKWEGVKEVKEGFAGLVARTKERGNRGQMKGQEVRKPQSSFVEMERWEDEFGFAGDGEESDDEDGYEHSEDEEWAM